jgi:hypothetical protein
VFSHKKRGGRGGHFDHSIWESVPYPSDKKYISFDVILHPSKNLFENGFFYECI